MQIQYTFCLDQQKCLNGGLSMDRYPRSSAVHRIAAEELRKMGLEADYLGYKVCVWDFKPVQHGVLESAKGRVEARVGFPLIVRKV